MALLRRSRLLIIVAALLIGGAVWIASTVQRHAADVGRAHEAHAQLMLTAMLDQETGVRGFHNTGQAAFLQPYLAGRREYSRAVAQLRGEVDADGLRTLRATDEVARRWQAAAAALVARIRARGPIRTDDLSGSLARKALFDAFRLNQGRLSADLEHDRKAKASTASIIATVVSLLVALVVGGTGVLFLGRREREARALRERDISYRETQGEFADALQLAESEQEGHNVICQHLERTIPDAQITVLKRNNSANRLEPATRVADADLAEHLEGAEPRSCLAIRLGRIQERGESARPLIACELCGKSAGATWCRPLVVGSEIIGSVLAVADRGFEDGDRQRLRESVAQAAPMLANLRNLALAEARAATDALTGLPNRRAIDDTLKRMVAQAGRSIQPLTALMVDVDHFKTINDLYGHEGGDQALAALGALFGDSLRESDFAGRMGGEEFVVLAPGTDAAGGATLAENLRAAIASLRVDTLDHSLTASIGVATFPEAASDHVGLLRMADRALYAAKQRGRNRVETAARFQRTVDDTDSTAAST